MKLILQFVPKKCKNPGHMHAVHFLDTRGHYIFMHCSFNTRNSVCTPGPHVCPSASLKPHRTGGGHTEVCALLCVCFNLPRNQRGEDLMLPAGPSVDSTIEVT